MLVLSVIFMWPSKTLPQSIVDRYLVRHGHALLIGVTSYNDPRWPPLENITKEIGALKAGLSYHFESIQTLIDPDSNTIKSALQSTIADFGSASTDRIFIYYSGHGFTDPEAKYMGYITGRDTPAYDYDRSGAILHSVSMLQFDKIFRGGAFKQGMAVFDSCFSGTIFTSRALPSRPVWDRQFRESTMFDFIRRPVRAYISAGRSNETVPPDSPLATLLLAGVEGEADRYENGFVTGSDLGSYLQNIVPRYTEGRDTPQFGKTNDPELSDGEFVFTTSRANFNPGKIYLLFFDWNSSNVTPEGMQIAQLATNVWRAKGAHRIQVTGYTDRANTPEYSLMLSEREAKSAAQALNTLGVPPELMDVSWVGEKYNRVPTEPGVREPQNRRVEIGVR
jgi:outer membrane protein OmpA-like peptidoglycan-associated protein